MNSETLRSAIINRLESQSFAILSTRGNQDAPHSTIVCFASADELETLIFFTPRASRKFANLIDRPETTLFIDDRSLFMGNLKDIWGIEARGRFREATAEESPAYRGLFLNKYPDLIDFVDAKSAALCLLDVQSYDAVHHFQDVMRYFPGAKK